MKGQSTKSEGIDKSKQDRAAIIAGTLPEAKPSSAMYELEPRTGGVYLIRLSSVSALIKKPGFVHTYYIRIDGQELPITEASYLDLRPRL